MSNVVKKQITFLDAQSGAFLNALWQLVSFLSSFAARKPLTRMYAVISEGVVTPSKLWLKLHQEFGEPVKDAHGNINYRVDKSQLEPERLKLYEESVQQIGGTCLYEILTPIQINLPESKANQLSGMLNLAEQSILEKFISIEVVDDSEADKLREENAKLKNDLADARAKSDQAVKTLGTLGMPSK